jgi:serine/threonine protein kinase
MPAQTYQAPPLSSLFKAASRDAQSLLAGMLQLNPAKRLTAREALLHPYFQQPPRPTPHERLPKTNTKPKNDAANTKRKWDILMHEDADQTTGK